MGSKKVGVKEGNSVLKNSRLFGILGKDETSDLTRNTETSLPVPLNYESRKQAVAPVLEAEHWKGQAITLVRQMSIR